MSRRSRMTLIIGGSVLGLCLGLLITAVFIARSDWFRAEVRRRIVAEAEKVTGGRVDMGAFDFDWHTLTARVNDLVIHGTDDPVLPYPHGLALARTIPGAKLLTLNGTGHELHAADWNAIVDSILKHTALN